MAGRTRVLIAACAIALAACTSAAAADKPFALLRTSTIVSFGGHDGLSDASISPVYRYANATPGTAQQQATCASLASREPVGDVVRLSIPSKVGFLRFALHGYHGPDTYQYTGADFGSTIEFLGFDDHTPSDASTFYKPVAHTTATVVVDQTGSGRLEVAGLERAGEQAAVASTWSCTDRANVGAEELNSAMNGGS